MVAECDMGWMVRVRFAGVQAVHLIGRFNNWSTAATPMRRGAGDVWEAVLATAPEPEDLRFFVWSHGEISGRLHHTDEPAA